MTNIVKTKVLFLFHHLKLFNYLFSYYHQFPPPPPPPQSIFFLSWQKVTCLYLPSANTVVHRSASAPSTQKAGKAVRQVSSMAKWNVSLLDLKLNNHHCYNEACNAASPTQMRQYNVLGWYGVGEEGKTNSNAYYNNITQNQKKE